MKVEHLHMTDIWPNLRHAESLIRQSLLLTGILMIALGVVAIVLPFVATMTLALFAAVVLIIAGAMHIIHAVEAHGSKGWVLRLLGGVLYGLAGLLLLAAPMRGILTLTVLLSALFILGGINKIVLAFHLRRIARWGWLLFSGVLSTVVGVLLWSGLPGTAVWAIGLLVGIELIFNGVSMTTFALSVRDSGK